MTQHQLALIREADCIGCTKCLDVCPTDAIIGTEKWMHTVIAADCIGCKLCVPACPVDCIELIRADDSHTFISKERTLLLNKRRKQRLALNEDAIHTVNHIAIDQRKDYIKEALLRAKSKKNEIK